VQGWISAGMLYDGLKGAGKDFTRAKVVAALNKMKAETLDGLIPPRDWTTNHSIQENSVGCNAYVKVENGKFVPTFTEPGKPFMCLPSRPKTLPEKATFTS
jgi:hypothetical protein